MKIDVIHSSNKSKNIFREKLIKFLLLYGSMPKCVQPPRERFTRMQVWKKWCLFCGIAGLTFDYINAFQLLNDVGSHAHDNDRYVYVCVCVCVCMYGCAWWCLLKWSWLMLQCMSNFIRPPAIVNVCKVIITVSANLIFAVVFFIPIRVTDSLGAIALGKFTIEL